MSDSGYDLSFINDDYSGDDVGGEYVSDGEAYSPLNTGKILGGKINWLGKTKEETETKIYRSHDEGSDGKKIWLGRIKEESSISSCLRRSSRKNAGRSVSSIDMNYTPSKSERNSKKNKKVSPGKVIKTIPRQTQVKAISPHKVTLDPNLKLSHQPGSNIVVSVDDDTHDERSEVGDQDNEIDQHEDYEDSDEISEIEDAEFKDGVEGINDKKFIMETINEYKKELRRDVEPDHPSVPTAYYSMERYLKKGKGWPASDKNRKGRKLLLWHRPRMMEKLLLCIQYECHVAGIKLPWDKIVHRLEPGCSGPSAVQMLNKIRDGLMVEGHMVPPAMSKGLKINSDIRGYTRDLSSDNLSISRPVLWGENFPNAKRSLNDAGFTRGSGNYRKADAKTHCAEPKFFDGAGKVSEIQTPGLLSYIKRSSADFTKPRVPTQQELMDAQDQLRPRNRERKPRSEWKKPGPKPGSKRKIRGPTHRDSDADHPSGDWSASSPKKRRSSYTDTFLGPYESRAGKIRVTQVADSLAVQGPVTQAPASDLNKVIARVDVRGIFIIRLPPVSLARVFHNLKISVTNPLGGELFDGVLDEVDGATEVAVEEQQKKYEGSNSALNYLVGKKLHFPNWKGICEHGEVFQYHDALQNGLDPRYNGRRYEKTLRLLLRHKQELSQKVDKQDIGAFKSPSGVDWQILDEFIPSDLVQFPRLPNWSTPRSAKSNQCVDPYLNNIHSSSIDSPMCLSIEPDWQPSSDTQGPLTESFGQCMYDDAQGRYDTTEDVEDMICAEHVEYSSDGAVKQAKSHQSLIGSGDVINEEHSVPTTLPQIHSWEPGTADFENLTVGISQSNPTSWAIEEDFDNGEGVALNRIADNSCSL